MGELETVQTQTNRPVGLSYEEVGDLTEDELFELAVKQLKKTKKPPGCLTISEYQRRERERTGEPIGRTRAANELNLLVEECGWKKRKIGTGWIYWFDGDTTGQEV